MKTLSEYIKENLNGDYFWAWDENICVCRQDLVDGLQISEEEAEKISDFKMQELINMVAKELKTYSPFEYRATKIPADKAFKMYFAGEFGDAGTMQYIEEKVDDAWWKELKDAAVKLNILK